MLKRLEQFIREHDLFPKKSSLVLGVSGGPDSLCLLDLLCTIGESWALTVTVAHLNHGIRAESVHDVGWVRAIAEARGLNFHTATVDVPAYANTHKQSLEEVARTLRYQFLADVAHQIKATHIAVAHTADDQAETVLMHFLRGAGVAGLRGMLPKTTDDRRRTTEVSLVRPLLFATRVEVEEYCVEHNLQFLTDPTNADTTYFRNRLRHELLPQLATYNPNIRQVLNRTATVLAGEHELLQKNLAWLWEEVVVKAQATNNQSPITHNQFSNSPILFSRSRWFSLSLPEQRMLLREAARRLLPDELNIDFTPLEHAIRWTQAAQTGRACDVLGNLCLVAAPDAFMLQPWNTSPALPDDVPLLADDKHTLMAGWRFRVEEVKSNQLSVNSEQSRWSVVCRPPSVVALRARQRGDFFYPLGFGKRVKLSDFFINTKVPQAWRDRWPLVVCNDDIVWVAGLRLDDRYQPHGEKLMRLSFEKLEITNERML